ncbi:hypothetical protein EOD39_12469 [Acipenser ruthenus]|uniref:Uncharacterized protein n=1 Tax=Acipenser ruthenus TaxID=7906 RepID=A0A444UL59_ACIRT|nr:hypothetical protein EOD39_12469 [Acipenser ruthenus]
MLLGTKKINNWIEGYIHEVKGRTPSLGSQILNRGDFNIHVDLPPSTLVTDFVTLLDCLGLSQSVNVPTHTCGHTLDLLITRGLDISNPSVSDISL